MTLSEKGPPKVFGMGPTKSGPENINAFWQPSPSYHTYRITWYIMQLWGAKVSFIPVQAVLRCFRCSKLRDQDPDDSRQEYCVELTSETNLYDINCTYCR